MTADTLAIWAETPSADGWIMGNSETETGLPWPAIPEDLAHFREQTRDRLLIMGRNTFNKLPASMKTPESLAERPIVVLTRNPEVQNGRLFATGVLELDPESWTTDTIDEPTTVRSLVNTLGLLAGGKQAAIIGGPDVIELFLPAVDRMAITMIWNPDYANTGDVRAPDADLLGDFVGPITKTMLTDEADSPYVLVYSRADVVAELIEGVG